MSNYPDGDMLPEDPRSPLYDKPELTDGYPAVSIRRLVNIQLGDVDSSDHPDYCDAYVAYAEIGGRALDNDELDWLAENGGSEIAQERAFESLL